MAQPQQSNTAPSTSNYIELHVDQVVNNWARQNISKIVSAYQQKGGWEGWAQVEIATALEKSRESASAEEALKGTLTEASREVHVYADHSKQRADVVIASRSRIIPKHFVIIELKCEGQYFKGDFVQEVEEDIEKLKGRISDDFKPAKAWALAISTSQEVYDKMLAEWPNERHVDVSPPLQLVRSTLGDRVQSVPKIVIWSFQVR